MAVQTYTGALVVKRCPACGIVYGVDEGFDLRKHDDETNWYCPNGHSLRYTQSTEHKLRAELDQIKADRDYWQRSRREEIERLAAEKRRHAATKGQLTKTRKRADAGVCQHCNRTFANVGRHVAHMHPDAAQA